jgi:hypothetical protein
MIDILVKHRNFTEIQAYLLCGVAMKLRLSQVLNEPMYTVSAAIRKSVLPKRDRLQEHLKPLHYREIPLFRAFSRAAQFAVEKRIEENERLRFDSARN